MKCYLDPVTCIGAEDQWCRLLLAAEDFFRLIGRNKYQAVGIMIPVFIILNIRFNGGDFELADYIIFAGAGRQRLYSVFSVAKGL